MQATIEIGGTYPFHSTLQGEDGEGVLVRRFTGRTVTVVRRREDISDEIGEAQYDVRAADGTTFSAWEGELDGSYARRGPVFGPED